MDSKIFIEHRKKIFDLMEDQSVMIIFSNLKSENKNEVQRNFFYLTGVKEEKDIVLLYKHNQKQTEMIFIQPYDELQAKWVGKPFSVEEVKLTSGIFGVHYLEEWKSILYRILPECRYLYVDLNRESVEQRLTEEELFIKETRDKNPWLQVLNARPLFQKARTIKDSWEIEQMRKAIDITQKGIESILANIGPMMEYQLESYFDQSIKYFGASGYSFPTIAASGQNGCCLHYQENNCKMQDGDLVLFDLGAHVNMYCADISRTFPVNGKFSPRQREIYEIVLGGQSVVFEHAKPGITTKELNQILIQYFAKELKRIGLIQEDSEVSRYYYHGVSHHIGLDCHDLCEYTPLKPGSVISNEPGLYIAEEKIGIRIEDDVLITENGCENLSQGIIKTVDEIEAFIARRKEERK
ncbi:MAG: aminopeptidase P N-terminal domain-containing protein [Anaeroplasmataceae bacterium]|nr:aminopeptidase P N-terminal domain-containing protein [Anaeroplasmataceae bacterium]